MNLGSFKATCNARPFNVAPTLQEKSYAFNSYKGSSIWKDSEEGDINATSFLHATKYQWNKLQSITWYEYVRQNNREKNKPEA